MAYDVFLVSAIEDRDMAKLVARRLRSLKFKVWFDQKQVDNTFDAKDARNAGNSKHMLVMWSEHAVKSDWVRAAASVGHSRPGMLAQVSVDKTIPYEPFKSDKRFSIEGMTSRKTPEGFYKLIEELGQRDGRSDLREWMGYGSKDEEAREDWLTAHPDDPLAIDAKKKREKAMGIKPAPAAETANKLSGACHFRSIGHGMGHDCRSWRSRVRNVFPELDFPLSDDHRSGLCRCTGCRKCLCPSGSLSSRPGASITHESARAGADRE